MARGGPDRGGAVPVQDRQRYLPDQCARSRPRVRVRAPVRLDLGGVGKGHAVDRVAAVLREWGIGEALIHAGTSSVIAVGGPWSVALRHPRDPLRGVGQVALRDAALGASAILLNGPHITDPRSGHPVSRPGSWVRVSSAALADALSTACLVLPVSAMPSLCRRVPGLSVMIAAGGGSRMGYRRFGSFGPVTRGAA